MSLIAGNLGAVQRLLDGAGLDWGVCAGAAAYAYGSRRPIANVDILLASGKLWEVRHLLEEAGRMAQCDGRILLWRGVKLFDDLTLTFDGRRYPFFLDAPMIQHLRRLPLLGARVQVLSPEDVLVHKALLRACSEQEREEHRRDFEALLRFQGKKLDWAYIGERVRLCQAEEKVGPILEKARRALAL